MPARPTGGDVNAAAPPGGARTTGSATIRRAFQKLPADADNRSADCIAAARASLAAIRDVPLTARDHDGARYGRALADDEARHDARPIVPDAKPLTADEIAARRARQASRSVAMLTAADATRLATHLAAKRATAR